MSLADKILAMLGTILEAGKGLIPFDEYAAMLLKLVQTGVASYEAHTGQPIDPSLLHPIDPIV